MPFDHAIYNQRYLHNPGNEAAEYGVSIVPARENPNKIIWRCIGIHHLTGPENGGNHHVYLDVLDEKGKRIEGARLMVINNGKVPYQVMIDKPTNEAGANIPMYFNDTLSVYVAGDIPGDKVEGFHTRHEDEEPGTSRGHHSFYVVWQRQVATEPEPEPEEPEQPEEPGPGPIEDWRDEFWEPDLKLIEFIRDTYRPGSTGIIGRMEGVIARMADLLDGKA